MADVATSGRVTRDELADSLLFYRRQLTGQLAREMIRAAGPRAVRLVYPDVAHEAEDIANAITERLAARETGDPNGYK